MRLHHSDPSSDELINMSSLLDVLFILLIFFMVTTTFQEEERDIEVNLPSDSKAPPSQDDTKLLVINVRKDGAYVLQSKQMTVDEMTLVLKQSFEKNEDQKVLVRADQEALHGHVAHAISLCKVVGIHKANIGYDTKTAH